MKLSRSLLLSTVALACISVSISACKHDATDQANDARDWLVDYYKKTPIRGSWAFFGSSAKDSNVRIILTIPVQQGKELQLLNEEDGERLIRMNACPPRNEKVWSILEGNGDIIIDARASGSVIATVSCKGLTHMSTEQ